MKIMFYISTICNGGAARVMSNLANMLSERGHDCTLITTFRTLEEYHLAEGVKRISFYDQKPTGAWLTKNVAITRMLRRQVKQKQPDLLVSFLAEPNFRAAIATIGLKTKTIVSVRNDPNREYRGLLPRLLAKYLFRRVDGIVFQTADAKQWFPVSIQRKGRIIFNAVKEEFYNITLGSKPTGIVATGRLNVQKNHPMLIRAYSKIANKVTDDLIIYGAGDPSELMSLSVDLGVANRVHIPGQTMNVAGALKNAKVYVMSSDFEGMPNALMEAMAMGLPCISTDCPCGGPRSLFTKEMYHFLTKVGDADEMSKRLLELINNPDIRIVHGLHCKQAASSFRPSIINSQWENYLKEIIASE